MVAVPKNLRRNAVNSESLPESAIRYSTTASSKGVPWGAVFMVAATSILGSALTKPDAGKERLS